MTVRKDSDAVAARQRFQLARLLQWQIKAADKKLLDDEDIKELIDIEVWFPSDKQILAALEASSPTKTLKQVAELRANAGEILSKAEILAISANGNVQVSISLPESDWLRFKELFEPTTSTDETDGRTG